MNNFGPFDIVFCRHVLVYFDGTVRKKILCLLLGGTKTTLKLEDRFQSCAFGKTVLYRVP